MTKTYNKQTFTFTVNGEPVAIYCNTTHVPTGFVHHAYLWGLGREGEHTRIKYVNRTWESFDYESVLKAAAAKLKKDDREALILEIERHGNKEREKCNNFLSAFESNYQVLSTEQKNFLRQHTPHLETESQAKAVAGVVSLLAAMNSAH